MKFKGGKYEEVEIKLLRLDGANLYLLSRLLNDGKCPHCQKKEVHDEDCHFGKIDRDIAGMLANKSNW